MRPLLPLAVTVLLSGCGASLPAQPLAPARPLGAASTIMPALSADRISLTLAADHHHVHVVGAGGALKGAGVWGSPGRHEKPTNGQEAAAGPEGGFELELHAHPGETVTLWAFVDAGDRRHYSKPHFMSVPSKRLKLPQQG